MLATVPFARVVAPVPTLGAGALPVSVVVSRSDRAPPSRPPRRPATRATATATPMSAPHPGPRPRCGSVPAGAVSGGYEGEAGADWAGSGTGCVAAYDSVLAQWSGA